MIFNMFAKSLSNFPPLLPRFSSVSTRKKGPMCFARLSKNRLQQESASVTIALINTYQNRTSFAQLSIAEAPGLLLN